MFPELKNSTSLLLKRYSVPGSAFHKAFEDFQLKCSELGCYPGECKAWHSPALLFKSLSHLREQNPSLSPARTEVFISFLPEGVSWWCAPCQVRGYWMMQMSSRPHSLRVWRRGQRRRHVQGARFLGCWENEHSKLEGVLGKVKDFGEPCKIDVKTGALKGLGWG